MATKTTAPETSNRPRPFPRVFQPHDPEETSKTKQEFKDDCDINRILAKYQRTGALSHFAKYAPQYGEFNALDLQSAQNLLINARKMFDELPSNVRAIVSTPAGFLDFVQDPKNAEKMAELGLKASPPPIAKPPELAPEPPLTP